MDDLAGRANCSNSTIRDFEARRREPHKNRLAAIRQALEVAGMVFSVGAGGDTAMVSGPIQAPVENPAVAPVKKKPPGRASRSSGRKRKVKARAA
jgi:hypothetical protein